MTATADDRWHREDWVVGGTGDKDNEGVPVRFIARFARQGEPKRGHDHPGR
eukprot:SAG22_NODE_11165_length_497_cov_1.271357_1_plen_50_part_01